MMVLIIPFWEAFRQQTNRKKICNEAQRFQVEVLLYINKEQKNNKV
jgi:hypothetical protein